MGDKGITNDEAINCRTYILANLVERFTNKGQFPSIVADSLAKIIHHAPLFHFLVENGHSNTLFAFILYMFQVLFLPLNQS